jgi:hypothetical protein
MPSSSHSNLFDDSAVDSDLWAILGVNDRGAWSATASFLPKSTAWRASRAASKASWVGSIIQRFAFRDT